jgi:hypothetical protein
LQYVTPIERVLCGRLVRRAFALKTPRIAVSLAECGIESAAMQCSANVLALYTGVLCFAGLPVLLAGSTTGFYLLLTLSILCGAGGFARALAGRRACQRLRQDRETKTVDCS